MTSAKVDSAWNSGASHYLTVAQPLTLFAAHQLIKKASSLLPFDIPDASVLDNGCGTGSLTMALHEHCPTTPILAADLSVAMVDILADKKIPNVETQVVDALDLSGLGQPPISSFSHALSTFMIQFTDAPRACVREMHRVLRPGGVLGLATWSRIELISVLGRAGQRLDPTWTPPDPYSPEWPASPDEVCCQMEELGFAETWAHEAVVDAGNDATNATYLEYAFKGGNPTSMVLLQEWRERGMLEEVRRAAKEILEIEYADRKVETKFIIAVGTKV